MEQMLTWEKYSSTSSIYNINLHTSIHPCPYHKLKLQTLFIRADCHIEFFTLASHQYVFNWPLNANSFSNIQI